MKPESDAETDDFVDERTSEPEEPAAEAEPSGGDEDIVFTDEVNGPSPAAAPRGATPPASRRPPPERGVGEALLAPPANRPPRPEPPARPERGQAPAPPGRGESGRMQRPPSDRSAAARAPGERPSSDRLAIDRSSGGTGERPAPAAAEPPGSKTSSSGRLRALGTKSSGAHPVGPGSSSGRQPRAAARPERTKEEDAAAVAALEAQVQTPPAGDPFLGRDLGAFKVEKFVGLNRGERRYIGTHTETKRTVLVRVFPLAGSFGEEFKRLADRGERTSRIESPFLDCALAAGRTKEVFYAGFDPPIGVSLDEVLRTEGPLPEAEVLSIIDASAKALGALHSRDLFHTHLSTSVVRRVRPGAYLLEDAGLARPRPALSFLAAGGDVLGLPGFVAPETVDSGEITKASDLYSLGCVAWTLLVGRAPFTGDDEVQVLLDQLNHEVPALAPALPEGKLVSEATQTIVAKLTGYTTDVRYRDVHELLQDLKRREEGGKITPFVMPVKPEDLRPKAKLHASTTSLIVLAVVNAALLTIVILTAVRAKSIPLDDPLQGLEVPLPAGNPATPPR